MGNNVELNNTIKAMQTFADRKGNNNGKVDHPPNGHKDVLDAVAGATYNASRNAEQYAFDYGEDLTVTNTLNNEQSVTDQQQMVIDFEAEMMKLLDNVSADDLVDFLEKEGVTNKEGKKVRSIDIAQSFNYSRASISRAINNLTILLIWGKPNYH